MPPHPSQRLPVRLEEIHQNFVFWLDGESGLSKLSVASTQRHVRRYLLWLQCHPEHGTDFDDPDARDRAAWFFRQHLFTEGSRPRLINSILAAVSKFYVWWGTGEHHVRPLPLHPAWLRASDDRSADDERDEPSAE